MENSSELFQLIFNRTQEQADTKSYLEHIAAEHPYFPAAQFYLLLQTKKDDPAYSRQVQKTAALFNNSYWLNYLVNSSKETSIVFSTEKQNETIIDETTKTFSNDTVAAEVIEKTELSPVSNEQLETGTIINESTGDEITTTETATFDDEQEAVDQDIINAENEGTEPVYSRSIEQAVQSAAAELQQPSPASNTAPVSTNEQHSDRSGFPQEVNGSAEPLLFQPLHTSDYFASVGIKLSEEANANDRLGKQLKSFTQWLKTMKKIDAVQADNRMPDGTVSETTTQNIQTLAEKSNKEDEVITEAMADVLIQQGRINKAVEVLKKLSLLNPSKSTYFAAKIEQLKD